MAARSQDDVKVVAREAREDYLTAAEKAQTAAPGSAEMAAALDDMHMAESGAREAMVTIAMGTKAMDEFQEREGVAEQDPLPGRYA